MHSTDANYNNQIREPHTVLPINVNTGIWVVVIFCGQVCSFTMFLNYLFRFCVREVLYFEKNMVRLFLVVIYFNGCKVSYGSFHYFSPVFGVFVPIV